MKVAIVCAAGIGDALLMQICAKALQTRGMETVTFSKHLPSLASWFPGFCFAPNPTEEILSSFDAIVLQYDNTPRAQKIRALNKSVYTFYGDYQSEKHGALRPGQDAVFDPKLCMAENIANAVSVVFPGSTKDLANGLVAPTTLIHRAYPRRIAIHPTSSASEKNWRKTSFLHLRDLLARAGWEPVFIVPPEEASAWNSPTLPTLADLAAFLYESGGFIGNDSGPGHLASNLGLSTLIIGPSQSHLTYWRPGWKKGEIVYPPQWVNQFKLSRVNWKYFVSVNQVFKIFNKLKLDL